jgi:hypothetical protein
MSATLRTAGCLCGAVQLSLIGEPFGMAYCHCESCRRWFGAPVHAGCLWPDENVRVVKGAEHLTLFKRTERSGSHRQFCSVCGAPVLVGHPDVGMTDVPAVSVSNLEFKPTLHTHYPERVVAFRDGLPKYRYFDPAIVGDSETVPE